MTFSHSGYTFRCECSNSVQERQTMTSEKLQLSSSCKQYFAAFTQELGNNYNWKMTEPLNQNKKKKENQKKTKAVFSLVSPNYSMKESQAQV